MRTNCPCARWLWNGVRLTILVLLLGVAFLLVSHAADHRDGPFFGPPGTTGANGRADINDLYIFQAPGNINNTVLVMTFSPFAGILTPSTFDQSLIVDMKIANRDLVNVTEDITFRVTFGAPDSNGSQQVTLRGLPASAFPPTGILARGVTNTNLQVTGGGSFFAGIRDDPFFFDSPAVAAIVSGQNPPPPPGGFRNPGVNAFGPDVNTMAFVLEIPTVRIRNGANTQVGYWARTERNGVQMDRMGRPGINTVLIPPVPRNNLSRGDRRSAFNAGHPRNDRRDFKADMVSVLKGFFGRTDTDANGLSDFLLPDILTFDTSTPFSTDPGDANGFPNGRRLRDDVIDVELKLLLNNPAATDNVNDDNGDRITDGTRRPDMSQRQAAFPYLGAPNLPLNGPGSNPAKFK